MNTSLATRNLSRNVFKAFLVARLKDSVANGMGSVDIFDPGIISNTNGHNFDPMAHWGLVSPEKDGVV